MKKFKIPRETIRNKKYDRFAKLKPEKVEELKEIWEKYDPEGKNAIPFEKLDEML